MNKGLIMPKKDAKTTKKWSHKVTTVSTFPPRGIFLRDAETIARSLSSKKVSPKGIGSGIRMVQFFINRAGKKLSEDRKRELEKAKNLMQEKVAEKRAKKR
jgi:tRNA(adenine34) deaminase